MRVFANLFLILFLADGSLSFVDELISLFSDFSALTPLRHVVAEAVILMSALVYTMLGIDRRLPKRVFIPLVAFVWLCPVSVSLFPALSNIATYGLFAASFQMLLFLLATAWIWRIDRTSFLLPQSLFEGPYFSWKNSLVFTGVNVLVTPCLLAVMIFTTTNSVMQQYTGGFMRLAHDGVHMSEKVYRRGDQTVRLAGMIHVGEKQYYDKVFQQQAKGRTIVLAEGVTDREHLLRNRLDYGKFAGYLGLSTQQDHMMFEGRMIDADDLEQPAPEGEAGKAREPDILRADVDLSSFRPPTLWFLNEMGNQIRQGTSLSQQLLASIAWSQKNMTPETEAVVVDDVLHRRNKELIRHFRKALRHYDVIVIPWGAMHMPEMEAEVKSQGFQLQEVHDRVSIHFSKNPPAK